MRVYDCMCTGVVHDHRGQKRAIGVFYHSPSIPLRQGLSPNLLRISLLDWEPANLIFLSLPLQSSGYRYAMECQTHHMGAGI